MSKTASTNTKEGINGMDDNENENGVTVPKWISVDDRLPEKDGAYLTVTSIFVDKRRFIELTYFAKDGSLVDEYELAGRKNVWYFYNLVGDRVSTDRVTHWMPLPEPPRGK